MAPMALVETIATKRTAYDAGFEEPKKQQRSYFRHHHIRWKQEINGPSILVCQDEQAIQSHITRAIILALKAVGFEGADLLALESFRAEVEEYMAHFLSTVRQSMLSSRRSTPLPQDFLQALHSNQLTLRSLLPHLDPPVEPTLSLPSLTTDIASGDDDPRNMQLIDIMLNDASSQPRPKYVPKHFPALPSQHTYKAEPVFNTRERDPRTLRERATEESRLGEEALRKLVGAASRVRSTPPDHSSTRSRNQTRKEKGEALWRDTMDAVTLSGGKNSDLHNGTYDPGGMEYERSKSDNAWKSDHMGPPVNSERRFWRIALPLRNMQPANVQG